MNPKTDKWYHMDQPSFRNMLFTEFDRLIDLLDEWIKLQPSRAASISKTNLETARLWFADCPPDPIKPEDTSNV